MKIKIITVLLFIYSGIFCQQIKYSTSWFGPNASPVPEIGNALIPTHSNFQIQFGNVYHQEEQTQDLKIKFEFPVLKERISLKIWMTALEYYQVTDELYANRQMQGAKSGFALGDVYIQNRFRLIQESAYLPNILIQSTLKTATGTQFYNRRYFDTPSYYFDLEFGKNLLNNGIYQLRLIADIGFYSWQMYSSVQNDAPMYSFKTNFKYNALELETEIAGYSGWKYKLEEGFGDRPMVWRNRLSYYFNQKSIYCSFEKGLRDYPFSSTNLGISVPLNFITPYQIKQKSNE